MQVTIHRGTKEIGGTCITVATDRARVMFDIGMPLMGHGGEPFDQNSVTGKSVDYLIKAGVLPDVQGLYAGQQRAYDAIFISHSHKDHYGLIKYLNPDIPVYMSRGAEAMIRGLDQFIRQADRTSLGSVNSIKHREYLQLGDLTVTAYSVDHSAFDALAFHVRDGEGKTLLYTGDFRAAGWTGYRLGVMTNAIERPLHCLLMEGTTMAREEAEYPDEASVVKRVMEIIEASPNDAVIPVYCSGQNIDRIVSLYKAVRNTRSTLVVDPYTACMMRAAGNVAEKIPQIDWRQIRVFVANYGHGDRYINKISDKDMIRLIGARKIKQGDFGAKQGRCLLLMRDTMIPVVEKIRQIKENQLIYSLWPGYIKDKDKSQEFYSFVERNNLSIEYVHASGHADLDTLLEVVKKLNPEKLAPIHTTAPHLFRKYFGASVITVTDGVMFTV